MEYHDLRKNNDIALAIALKSSQLQRSSNVLIEDEHVLKTLLGVRWTRAIPDNLNDIINDIISIEAEEIVAYLSSNAVIEGSRMHFNELKDLLGGMN